MKYDETYDKTNPLSIEKYAQRLIGKTFRQICDEDDKSKRNIIRDSAVYNASRADKKQKGGLGNLIEERFFHYPANDDSRPDFPEAGVELKVTPYKRLSNGDLAAKERLIITMINYNEVVLEDFDSSHLWSKSRMILLVYYLYAREIANRLDYRVDYARLFTPPQEDLAIIKHDFKVITDKIKAGKAHELSEGDTLYLGAATKSSDSKVRRSQPFSDVPAKPRAFAFKNSYMTYVLNNYIVPGKPKYESIIKGESPESFEDYVRLKIGMYRGWSVDELCKEFSIDISKKPKNITSILAFKMLDVKGNNAAEFVKAGVQMKAIRLTNSGTIKESMSFPAMKYKEIINETWEESEFHNYLSETRFFFVVYQFDRNEKLYLKGCQFWNIPVDDLENDVREVWEKTCKVLREGLQVRRVNGRNITNFPKASENRVSHVRPHAHSARDTDELPDGRQYPKHCFWLNNTYILAQLNQDLTDN